MGIVGEIDQGPDLGRAELRSFGHRHMPRRPVEQHDHWVAGGLLELVESHLTASRGGGLGQADNGRQRGGDLAVVPQQGPKRRETASSETLHWLIGCALRAWARNRRSDRPVPLGRGEIVGSRTGAGSSPWSAPICRNGAPLDNPRRKKRAFAAFSTRRRYRRGSTS